MNFRLRFLLAVALLVGAGVFLEARSRAEDVPPRKKLSAFPRQVGEWVGKEVRLQPEILEVLGPGEFLSQIYSRSPLEAPVDLFLAYFPSQRTGDTIHSPKHCLPGAGWVPVESGRIELAGANGEAVAVNRYIIAKGSDQQLVLYWYQAHGRVVASEYWGKFYLVADAIRMNRTDGALVRVITPVALKESLESAQHRAVEFAEKVFPTLSEFIPR